MTRSKNESKEAKDRKYYYYSAMPDDIEGIIRNSGFDNRRWGDYAIIFLLTMKAFYRKCTRSRTIKLSTLKEEMSIHKHPTIDALTDCKWLFYKCPVEGKRKDYIIQPILDMESLTPEQYDDAVYAIREGDFDELTRVVPRRIRQESMGQQDSFTSTHNSNVSDDFSCSSTEGRAGSDREAAALQTKSGIVSKHTTDGMTADEAVGAIDGEIDGETRESTHDSANGLTAPSCNNMYARLNKKQETRNEKQEIISGGRRNNQVTLADVRGQNPPPPSNKNSDFPAAQENSALIATEAFLTRLKPDDFDARRILEACGANRRFFTDNFDKLKTALLEYAKLRGKPDSTDERNIASFFVNCMGIKNVNRKIFSRVEELAKSASRYHKGNDPNYPYDLYDKDGQRVSQGKVIPQDAPPKPTRTSIWENGRWVSA